MKKFIAALIISTFTFGTLVATAGPLKQDTTKKHKRDSSKMKKDTVKKP
jgi:uncharacterized protein YdeI (BOF family)